MKKKYTTNTELKEYFSDIKSNFNQFKNTDPHHKTISTLLLAGDIMWLRKDWSNFLAPSLKTYIHSQDFFFANLETLISSSQPVPSLMPARATFNSYPSLLNEFDDNKGNSPFSALSIANNHSLDFGDDALLETIDFLNNKNIPYSGVKLSEKDKRYTVIEKNGIRIGFYAATYGMNKNMEEDTSLDFNFIKNVTDDDFNKVDTRELQNVLKSMNKEKIDFKIVSFHWGHEYEYYPKPLQIELARKAVEFGADIILGHHSHSQQPLDYCLVNYQNIKSTNKENSVDNRICHLKTKDKRKRKALIIYSIGNFITNMYEFLNEIGMLVSIELYRNKENQVSWRTPQLNLIINHKKNPQTNKRKTLFLREYLDQNCWKDSGCTQDEIEKVSFLKGLYNEDILN